MLIFIRQIQASCRGFLPPQSYNTLQLETESAEYQSSDLMIRDEEFLQHIHENQSTFLLYYRRSINNVVGGIFSGYSN